MRVVVYRNLNARNAQETWSIAELKGRVGYGRKLASAANVTLANVVFHVTPTGAAKLAAGANRSVHAWAIGDLAEGMGTIEVAYNPRKRPQWLFFHTRDGRRVNGAEVVLFAADGRAYAAGCR